MQNIHTPPRKPVVLIILDGFGVNPCKANNAVAIANTPRLDAYFAHYSHTVIQAAGHAVGLPNGQMGNSEVGHLTLGCGSIVRQDLVKIDDAITDGSFYSNPALLAAIDTAARNSRPLHLAGLVSDGGVHSHLKHLLALIDLCHQKGVRPVLHMMTDGRDTAPQSALNYLPQTQAALEKAGGSIATITGRYFAMDRDQRWERTERAWRAITLGMGRKAESPTAAIEAAYAAGETDEFIQPTVLPGFEGIQTGDALICFNFRKDRPRQIIAALAEPTFAGFDRGNYPSIHVTCMMEYDRKLGLPYAFTPEKPAATLAQTVSEAGIRQFHCAETEKYAHVTYFFNGGQPDAHPGEEHRLIPSPKVATYDLKPEMSAPRVADSVIEAIQSGYYPLIVVNFANGDMVGHTAILSAAVKAVETLDKEAGRVMDAAVESGYSVVLTADHGNCEELVDAATGAPYTQHTPYPVPCLIVDSMTWQLSTAGGLANIAPTVLQLMGLEKPAGMTAESLLLSPIQEVIQPAAGLPRAVA